MVGVGPGVGVAETGPTVSCAWLLEKPTIAIAATQTLRMNNLVSIMALLPLWRELFHQAGGVKPTRLVNGLATISLPSAIFNGSAGSALGAGPATKAPSAPGLYCDIWHGHSSSFGSASQSVTSQPVCGQIAV